MNKSILFLFAFLLPLAVRSQCVSPLPSGTTAGLHAVFFTQPDRGYIAGESGTLIRTTDGGATWADQDARTSQTINGLFFSDENNGWLVGDKGLIRRTANGGATWGMQLSPIRSDLNDVAFSSGATGLIVGACGAILRTTDGGSTWSLVPSGTDDDLLRVRFVNANTALASGNGGTLVLSTNGGASWAPISGTGSSNLTALALNGSTAWAGGGGGAAFRSTDAGMSWVAVSLPGNWHGAALPTPGRAYFVGTGGAIRESRSDGTYSDLSSPALSADLFDLMFPDSTVGYAVGASGALLKINYFRVQADAAGASCEGEPIALSGTYDGAGAAFAWTDPQGATISNQQNPTLSNAALGMGGIYTFAATINGCTRTDTAAVVIHPKPIINVSITASAACNQPTGSATANVTNITGTPTYLWSNGAMTQNLNNVAAGNYSVTVTSGNGCTATTSASVPGTNSPTVGIANTTPANCNQPTGSVTLSISGTTGTPTYLWSNGAMTQNLSNVAAGSYFVTVTSGNGCTATASAAVSGTNAPTVGIANTTPANCNQPTGGVTLSISGSTGTPTYLWSNGAMTQNLNNVAAGNYSVTVTSGNGCTATASATVPGTNAPTVGIANTTSANCNQSTGGVALSVSGATGTPTYLWSNGAMTQNLSNVAAGSYSVTVTSGNGCTATTSATVPGTNAPTVGIANTMSANCNQSTGSVTLSVSGATGIPTYLWSNGAMTQNLSNVAAGNYSVTVTSGNGCTATASATVSGTNAPTVGIANTMPANCNQPTGSVTLNVSGTTGTPTYLWSNGAMTQNLSNVAAGSYFVTVTSGNGCLATTSATVPGTTPPTVSIAGVLPVVCSQPNGAINISVIGAVGTPSYLWSNGATSPNLAGVPIGSYTVTVTSGNGCTATTSAQVTGTTAASVTVLQVTQPGCNQSNGIVVLSVTNAIGTPAFLWSNGATTQNLFNISAGLYTVTVTNGNGCTSTASADLSIAGVPAVAVSSVTPATCGLSNGSVGISVSGVSGTMQYLWSNGANTQNLSNVPAGNYTVTVTNPVNGCGATTSALVGGPMVEPFTFLCQQQSPASMPGIANGVGAISLSGGTPGYTVTWSGGVIPVAASAAVLVANLTAGSYVLTATDSGGCSEECTLEIQSATSNSCRASDSLSLRALFAATDGQNWTNKTNWLVAGQPIFTWHGITLDAQGCVTHIQLDNNNLSGALPNLDMSRLQLLSLAGNKIEGALPMLNTPQLRRLNLRNNRLQNIAGLSHITTWNTVVAGTGYPDVIRLEGNIFTFEDLLPDLNLLDFWADDARYAPQDSVFTDTLIVREIGASLTIDLGFDEQVPDNLYTWFKDGQPHQVLSSNKLVFNNLTEEDTGLYRARVTHPDLPQLTLYTRAVMLEVRPDAGGIFNGLTPDDPNGDNCCLVVDQLSEFPDAEMRIYNRWGELVFRQQPYDNRWRGTDLNFSDLPAGTYYYLLAPNRDGYKPRRGFILLWR